MKSIFKRILSVGVALTCVAGLMTGCGKKTEQTMMEKIKENGVLVLGTASGYPPYEFVSMDDGGKVIGIDVEFAQTIADKLGVDLKVVDMPYGELISNLATGKCDIAIAGMPETPEKAESIDFSNVYLNDQQSVIIRSEDVDKYKTLEDLYGKSIGVEKGSSSETVATDEITDAKVVALAKVPDLFLELKNSKIDAIVTAKVVGTQYIIDDSNLTFTDDTVQFVNKDKPCSAGIAKGNEEFVAFVNDVIKENQDNGNFDKWIEEYSKIANAQAGN